MKTININKVIREIEEQKSDYLVLGKNKISQERYAYGWNKGIEFCIDVIKDNIRNNPSRDKL